MSIADFSIDESLTVPPAVQAQHSTLITQSIQFVHAGCSEELLLIRILLGLAKIKYVPTGRNVSQTHDLSVMGAGRTRGKTLAALKKTLNRQSISIAQLDIYLKSSLAQRAYFKELLAEFCHALMRRSRDEHTLAFLHLYRILEHVSLAFPLLFVARSKDFRGSYDALKGFFGERGTGELKFFSRFVDKCVDEPVRNQSCSIAFNSLQPLLRPRVYGAYKGLLPSGVSLLSDVVDQEITLPCSGLLGLAINLRNRYFHYSNERMDNLSINDIGDSDAFFSCINDQLLNWLSVLYFHVLTERVRQ